MICWTLGITEHHNAVDNVLALISLVLLTGHVGRYGSGVNPLRGQNNVQGGGDMGALPNRLPGFQHVENDQLRAKRLLATRDFMVVQDIFLTATAELADVVLPAAASWAESEGTVTNSERRVQRVRKALDPPGEARDDLWIIEELARRMGQDWGEASAERTWDEVRQISPVHRGMTYARLEALGGIQWPCWDEDHPGELFLHSRLWEDPVPGLRAP